MRWAAVLVAGLIALLGTAFAACGGDHGNGTGGGSITVAAASDLRPAFDELAERFTDDTGVEVILTFGSSGLLAEQVKGGAPFDLFASASPDFVADVVESGRGDSASRSVYAIGRIVVWSPEREIAIERLADPAIANVAIANPTHAPYGAAAREALQSVGIFDLIEPKLVYGENVQDTQRLAESGNADAAIVALSLAIAGGGEWVPVPVHLYAPIEQELVVIGEGESAESAGRFADFLDSAGGREVMERYGFRRPAEVQAGGDRGGD